MSANAKEASARIKINRLLEQFPAAEIETEQSLVVANRDLIPRFERKIQTTLARVLGEADKGEG